MLNMDQRVIIVLGIIVAVALVLVLIWAIVNNKTDIIKKIVLACVVQAEKSLGSGTGELKYALVVDKVYEKLPGVITLFLSKKTINDFIENSVNKLKEVLSDGTTLSGYDDERFLNSNILNNN